MCQDARQECGNRKLEVGKDRKSIIKSVTGSDEGKGYQ